MHKVEAKIKKIESKNLNKSNLIPIPLKGQNFGLSKSDFSAMVELLKSGSEDLFERIFLSHFEDSIQYLIKNYRVEREVAYDAAMDTLIEFRQKLLLDKIQYGNLRFLFTKMAGQRLLKSFRKDEKVQMASLVVSTDNKRKEDSFVALERAWKILDGETKKLLESYYYNNNSLISLASKIGVSDATMRKKKQRCLQKLRNLFFKIYNSDLNE